MSCLRAREGRRERRNLPSPTSYNGMEIREQRGEGERGKKSRQFAKPRLEMKNSPVDKNSRDVYSAILNYS